MLLDKFKSNHTFNFFLFPLLGILFWLKDLVYPKDYPFYPGEESNLLYAPVHELMKHSVLLQNLVALSIFLLLAVIILQISIKYNIIRVRSMIPATLFVIMAGGFSNIHVLHPVYFGAVFFLIALYRLLSAFDQPQPYSAAFDTGFFLGISSLFYLSNIAFLPALLIGIGILSRESRWRNYLILLIGFFLPFLFGASFAFYTESFERFLKVMESNILVPNVHILKNTLLQGYIVFLIILIVLGSLKLIKDYDTKKVSTRKFFIVFFAIFLSSIGAMIFIPAVSQEMLLITVIPVTYLVTNYFVFLKSHFLGEVIFLSLVTFVIIMQFIP